MYFSRTVIIGTKPFGSSSDDFFRRLHESFPNLRRIVVQSRPNKALHRNPGAFIITPLKLVDVRELEIPTGQDVVEVKEGRKGVPGRTPVKEFRLREFAGKVSKMLDTKGMKTGYQITRTSERFRSISVS